MGEEWGERTPFAFFCDFHGELATAVREGRRREFSQWVELQNPQNRELIPDPNALSTFLDSKLEWNGVETEEEAKLDSTVTRLMRLRRHEIVPRLLGIEGGSGSVELAASNLLVISWTLGDRSRLSVIANLGDRPSSVPASVKLSDDAKLLFESVAGADGLLKSGSLPEWSVVFRLAAPVAP